MKKLSILVFLFLVLLNIYSQQKITPLIKAKHLIKKELFSTLNDFSSYQPVSFSKVEKLFSDPFENEEIIKSLDDLESYKKETGKWGEYLSLKDFGTTDTIMNTISRLLNLAKENKLDDLATEYGNISMKLLQYKLQQQIIMDEIKEHKPEFIGMKVIHKYRAKNSLGAYVLKSTEFRFDKNITYILKSVELE